MEGLIIFIIISLISMIFKGKEQKGQPPKSKQQMPPFSNPTTPKQPAQTTQKNTASTSRSLEDFAKEVFGQLEQQAEQAKKPAREAVQRFEKPAVVERVQEVVQQVSAPAAKVERPKMTERPLVQQLKQENEAAFQVVPTSREALMQAVVMSEILGAPKSRKRTK